VQCAAGVRKDALSGVLKSAALDWSRRRPWALNFSAQKLGFVSPGLSGVGSRLAIGWTMGTLVSALGVYLSLQIDLPTGATFVCTFGIILVLMAAVRGLLRRTLA
jgi:hypothetical protein